MGKARDIVDRFYETTDRHDADGIAPLLAEGMTFHGPLAVTEGPDAYVELNRQLLGFHAATRMREQFEDGDRVCSIYEMDLNTPAGDSITVEMADVITVTRGKISSQRIYYDPRSFEKAFGA